MKPKSFELWCQSTSCHGVADWFESKSYAGKIFWSVLILASFVLASWQVIELFKDFASPPHYRSITYPVDDGLVRFPNITVCNFNRASKQRALAMGMGLANTTDMIDSDYLNYLFMVYPTSYSLDITLDYYVHGQDFATKKVAKLKQKFENWKRDQNLSSSDVRDITIKLGMSCDEMMFEGCYDGVLPISCCTDAKPIINNYGLCWVLKTPKYATTQSAGNGRRYRLRPNLPSYTYEVVESNYLQEGIILGINFNPFDQKIAEPIFLTPGTSTQISLKSMVTTHDRPKYQIFRRNCIQNGKLNFFKGPYGKEYCTRDCMWLDMNATCGCIPLSESFREDVRFCEPDEIAFCIKNTVIAHVVQENSVFKKCEKTCMNPCEPEYSVATSVVTTKYPGDLFVQGFTDRLFEVVALLDEEATQGLEETVKEMSLVEIFFSTLTQTVIAEQEKAPVFNFISSVGGQLGLWLGVSIVTIFQMIFYAVKSLQNDAIVPQKSKPKSSKEWEKQWENWLKKH